MRSMKILLYKLLTCKLYTLELINFFLIFILFLIFHAPQEKIKDKKLNK